MTRPSNIVNFPERPSLDEEAARWVVRHDEGEMTATELAEFDAWRTASPQNGETFDRLRAHWNDLDVLGGLSDSPAPAVPARPAIWAGIGVAAAALIAVTVSGFALMPRPTTAPVQVAAAPDVGVYTTPVGGQEKITLEDGSIVTLNTASRIEARMTDTERSVRLLEGEAFFEVAHDTSRPFRVYAGDGVTVAVGTAFSVQLDNKSVKVVVSEGKVSFSRVAEKVEPVAFVAAGEAATFNENVVIEKVDAAEVSRKLSWTQGRLEFAGEPLSSVVADISRYTDIQFEFANQELADLRVGGVFEVGEVDDMLDVLETNFRLRAERIDDKHVRITGRDL